MPGEVPETSQYTSAVPAGAGATGKLRLALALTEPRLVESSGPDVGQALRPQ